MSRQTQPGTDAGAEARPRLSVIVPFHNEEPSVSGLLEAVAETLAPLGLSYEVVCVDDGSTDATWSLLMEAHHKDPRVRVVKLRRNFGQTAALAAGFDHARGEILITMDGDLQHDPREIPSFLSKLDEGYDVVSGWRQTRPDSWLTRRLPSRVANWLMARLSGLDVHDFGTTFKAYRREVLSAFELYGDFHRFIPALAHQAGFRIVEVPIQVRARDRGRSHYGLARVFTVFFDLIRIQFLAAWMARPLQIFGTLGLVLGAAGGLTFCWLVYMKYTQGPGYGLMEYRAPLFIVSVMTVLLGTVLFCFGLLGEILTRLYFGLEVRRPYSVEEVT